MTVAAAQANLDSAQLSVTSAEKALAATTLRAPMSGTVTAVNGSVGTTGPAAVRRRHRPRRRPVTRPARASPAASAAAGAASSSSASSSGSSFITLAQISRFKMQVSLSESDIGAVKVGQPATVTVNAASGEEFAARVDRHRRALVVLGLGRRHQRGQLPGHADARPDGQGPQGRDERHGGHRHLAGHRASPSRRRRCSGSTVTVEAADGTQTTQRVQTGVVGDSTTQVDQRPEGRRQGRRAIGGRGPGGGGRRLEPAQQTPSAARLGGGGLGGGLGGRRLRRRRRLPRRRRRRRENAVSALPAARRARRAGHRDARTSSASTG